MKNFILLFFLLCSCSHQAQTPKPIPTIDFYEFPVKKYSKLIEGGFSGLWFNGTNESGELVFWSHTDRGPNAENKGQLRPFIQPEFNPHLIKFALNPTTKSIRYLDELSLKLPNGKLMTGIPNLPAQPGRTGDETPVTVKGKTLPRDLIGIDPEGICFQGENLWMVEEYGPSILRFSKDGILQERIVAKGYYSDNERTSLKKRLGKDVIREVLPAEILTRRLNRGFEGVACSEEKIYAVLQSPLPSQKREVLIFEFDTKLGEVTRTIKYPMERDDADKIGDIAFYKNHLYLIEQNSLTGEEGFHRIYKIGFGKKFQKELFVDLVASGFDFTDKIEGLAFSQTGQIFVVNDNDFGLTGGIAPKTQEAKVDSNRKSVLGIINIPSL